MPVAAHQITLLAQQVQRCLVLVFVQLIGAGDAQLRLVEHQVLRGIGDVDRAVIGLHPALVRRAVGQGLLFKNHVPRRGGFLENLGVVHQNVRSPHIGHAIVHTANGVPGRVLQALVNRAPGRDQAGVDRLHALARDQPQRRIARRGHKVEPAFVHQGHHLVRCGCRLDVHLAAGRFFEPGDPVKGLVGLAAFDIACPGHDVQLAFTRPDGCNLRKGGHHRDNRGTGR